MSIAEYTNQHNVKQAPPMVRRFTDRELMNRFFGVSADMDNMVLNHVIGLPIGSARDMAVSVLVDMEQRRYGNR